MKTPVSLLDRLRNTEDADAWQRFVQLYTPLLYRWLTRNGCPQDEASDLMQDVFVTLVQVLPTFAYDRQKSFGGWLRTVAVNKWRDRARQNRSVPLPVGWLDQLEAVADPFWESEYRSHLARRALEIMRADFSGNTWGACWKVVAEGRRAPEVAKELGMTVGAVHAARFRVLERLRQEISDISN